MLPILAVTGLAKEARLASGPGVVAIGAGGNPQRLRALLAARKPPNCRAVVSIGIAGGLAPDLAPGDVVIASEIIAGQHRYPADAHIADALMDRLADLGGSVRRSPIAGVETAILAVADKTALHIRTGAIAVDMESHVAADFAASHGLPFAAIRIVCDPADRAIPAFAAQALKPDGEPDIAAVLRALLRDPRRIGPLMHLARDSGRAFATLTRCRPLLGPGLGVP
ncbi:5'-methylthioadenosine/S-adenosylhomocysteine nucleosidase [Methylobacterium adhaesivum]|uniref:Phosphorylase n=1 Tax=Methylobacterium adhaesivum TaxID=333297 RepID=A0ABT8BGG8_9HYPH|nr:phosphorylase [Methylobacterium adhaesivum]MDN3591214.1 phosphorylase [Methylobacterium adhaesivum]GJD32500.1 5'-methylthioadenosine/S-adenosylhomocysteine nucleosidase [Methylobacterium adhaesivum]